MDLDTPLLLGRLHSPHLLCPVTLQRTLSEDSLLTSASFPIALQRVRINRPRGDAGT